MSFMKFRQCGCDCRDDELFTYTNTAPCCDQCPDWQTPCTWIARFGCDIKHEGTCVAAADTVLRQHCYFGDFEFIDGRCTTPLSVTIPGGNCKFVALGTGSPCSGITAECPGSDEFGIEDPATSNSCSWDDIEMASVYPPTIDLGYSWVLTITVAGATLEYDSPFGTLSYTTETWNCAEPNTMELTSGSDLVPELPRKLCVVPRERPSEGGCNNNVPCGYTDPADRCACCDPCCDDLPPQPLFITCGACSESTTVTPTVGGGNGLDGVDSPSGQTYGACATLCGKEICGNWYCSSGQWKLDGYVDGDFCGTGDLTHECCPLTLGTTTLSGCAPSGCDICVGEDCEPPCDPTDCADYPETMTATFSGSACFSGTITMSRTISTEWVGDSLVSSRWSIGLTCNGDGTFTLTAIDANTECAVNNFTSTSAECDPVAISFGSQNITDLGGCACIGDTVTVSVSA